MCDCCPCDVIHLVTAVVRVLHADASEELEVDVLILWANGPQDDLLSILVSPPGGVRLLVGLLRPP
eukprot:34131-Amphidinium_carterae.1